MMVKIKCPDCGVEGSISLVEANYEGPYKCWKCHALFTIKMVDHELKSCEPLDEEEMKQQQELDALKNKFKR